MSSRKSIHTLNARGNIFLEVVRDQFDLKPHHMFRQIASLRQTVEDVLAPKGISYDELRTALTPDRKKREIALIFDSNVIGGWYGHEVGDRIMPLFHKKSSHSVLAGEYIDVGAADQKLLHDAMTDAAELHRPLRWEHSSQYYIIYINNLTDAMVEQFHTGLADYDGYAGYADTSYASRFKTLLSLMLPGAFLKHGKFIIQGHEDDVPNEENWNTYGYPIEKYGYATRSLQSMLQGTFLSYKIECPVFPGFEVDTEFSLNAISQDPLPLGEFAVEVEEAKLGYLKSEKADSLSAAGLEAVSARQLAALIEEKISASYIYNMSYDEEFDVAKFNVIVEVPGPSGKPVRLLAALEYLSRDRRLRLITFY
ncbi:hypothetical protein [Devosia sp.]|uniref:hypothetical protein n=1 Tax=Devosia sp. TaxID=1871048 RepID=UPI00292DCE0E|nr:hypothetical protein [Devosia sp.]